ncbi:MAG TPA: hypothetical protein VF911_05675 [Thermoanaerobaculia bacterium]|jgi:hypothetical protein
MSAFAETIAVVAGLLVVAVLIPTYLRLRQRDVLDTFVARRRGSARLVTRAEYVEGPAMIPVALALTETTFHYENADLEASFDLDRIDEIEYDDDLATGRTHRGDCRVLRVRSHGAAFEFLLDAADCSKWTAALPPRSYGNFQTAHAV